MTTEATAEAPSANFAPATERVMTAILAPLYQEQARRAGRPFSNRVGVPGVLPLGECGLTPMLGELSLNGLAELKDPTHPANEEIEVECPKGCGTRYTVKRFFQSFVCCDACSAKAIRAQQLEAYKTYWHSICPPAFIDTSREHADFPKGPYEQTRGYCGTSSLLLYGASGRGKTRLAMWLLKRCLTKFNQHVGVMWPEQLKHVKHAHDRMELVQKWGRYDVLLMDDALLTGAQDERVTDFLKDLLDLRMRHKRHQIITSQIGSEEYKEQADKFENITKADYKRVDALLRRVKEICTVVPFIAPPTTGQEPF
jgi:DNA replication protein DnaC